VSTWRRLQQLGAIPLKQAVYVLPDTPSTREDCEWSKTEVTGIGGDATVFASANLDMYADDALIEDRNAVPDNGVPFDMFGVEFSHQADRWTFETLCAVFGIRDPAIEWIAAVVHDLDLKDERFGAPQAPTIGGLLDALQLAHTDDQTLLAQGMDVFEALYRSFEQATRSPRPRATASRRKRPTASLRGRKRK